MSTLIRQRALQTWLLSICIIAVLLSLNFSTLKQCIRLLLKFYSKQKFVWFWYLIVFISTLLFLANSYLFYLVLLLKITLFNTVHCDGKNLTRLWYRCYEWEKLELTPLSERICELKAGKNRASIDSSEIKRIMLDYQLTVLLVKVVRTTFSANSEPE